MRASLLWVSVLALAIGAIGCGQSIAGRACSASDPCPDEYACAPAHDGTPRCMRTCTLDETVCSDGKVCLPLSSGGGGACYLGGNVAIGQPCTSDLDCTRTALCLHSSLSADAICLQGCNVDGTYACPNSQPCLPAIGGAGYCAAH